MAPSTQTPGRRVSNDIAVGAGLVGRGYDMCRLSPPLLSWTFSAFSFVFVLPLRGLKSSKLLLYPLSVTWGVCNRKARGGHTPLLLGVVSVIERLEVGGGGGGYREEVDVNPGEGLSQARWWGCGQG